MRPHPPAPPVNKAPKDDQHPACVGLATGSHFQEQRKQQVKIETLLIIGWRIYTAGTVGEKVRINQSNVLCQPASNCILTKGNTGSGLGTCSITCATVQLC